MGVELRYGVFRGFWSNSSVDFLEVGGGGECTMWEVEVVRFIL